MFLKIKFIVIFIFIIKMEELKFNLELQNVVNFGISEIIKKRKIKKKRKQLNMDPLPELTEIDDLSVTSSILVFRRFIASESGALSVT